MDADTQLETVTAVIVAEVCNNNLLTSITKCKREGSQGKTIKRSCSSLKDCFYELGKRVKKYIQMSEDSFWKLNALLAPSILIKIQQENDTLRGKTLTKQKINERKQFYAPPNGITPTET